MILYYMGNIKLYQAFPVSPSYNSQSAIRVAISQLVVRGLKQDSVSLIVQYRLAYDIDQYQFSFIRY